MKLIDVIAEESILSKMGKALFGRTFKSAAEEIIYKNATKDLSEAIYQARRAGRDFGDRESWAVVKPHVQNTQYATDKDFIQEIYDDSYKMADKRIKQDLKAAREAGKQTGQVTADDVVSKKAKLAKIAIAGTGLYVSLQGESGSPLDEFSKNMEWAEYKKSIGPNPDPKEPGKRGFTKEEFEKYRAEEMGICVTKLAASMVVFSALGVGSKLLQFVLRLFGASASTAVLTGAASKIAAFTMLATLINKDQWPSIKWGGKVHTTKEAITILVLENHFPLTDISWAVVMGSTVAFIKDAGVAGWETIVEAAANYNDPNFKEKSKPQGTKVAEPEGGQASEAGTNMNSNASEWKKTPSGYYQNTKTKEMISPHEYQEKFGN